jgi:Rrf2 family iron-sulfur cluster assembly transcriptional regulator
LFSVSQSTGYAILALTCLEGSPNQWVLARDIAACTDVPPSYLAKILRLLSEAGLVIAKRGYRGGVRLARPAGEINLLEVTIAIEGRSGLTDCVLNLSECSEERACPSHRFWKTARQRIRTQLESISLTDTAAFERKWHGSRLKCRCIHEGGDHGIDGSGKHQALSRRSSIKGRPRVTKRSSSAPARLRPENLPQVHGGGR